MADDDQAPPYWTLISVLFSTQPLTPSLAMTLHQTAYELYQRGDPVGQVAGDLISGKVHNLRKDVHLGGIFGPAFEMHTAAASGTCDYSAPFQQHGGLRIVNGTFTCSNGRSGAFSMTNATVSWGAFAAHFSGNGITSGHMEGARIEFRGDAP